MPWTPCPISAPAQTPSIRRALLEGALHGPAELLPISSSGHLGVIPWLLGWPAETASEARKEFEVALHAGATAAWLLAPGGGGRQTLADLRRSLHRPAFVALALAPPAAAGLLLEEAIERRLGTPATIAVGLALSSVAMLTAERRAPTRSFDRPGSGNEVADEPSATDGLVLGLAQASALFPGVSRSGATIAAARLRGWGRRDSRRVANLVGLPVIAGAALLKGLRIIQRPPPAPERAAMAAGAGASFGSAWLMAPLSARAASRSLAPYAAYRLALVLAIAARLRRCA